MIRVLVVDDHEFVRSAVSSALTAAGGIEVVATCGDGQEALGVAVHTRPDVVLMDLSMPRLDGVQATRQMIATDPDARIVILTSAIHGRMVGEAMAAGAVSCVFKDADANEVIKAVRSAARPVLPSSP